MADNSGDSKGFPSSSSPKEGNRNKGMQLADLCSPDIPDLSSSLMEFPLYELLPEKIQEALIKFGSSSEASCDHVKEGKKGARGFLEKEWNDPIVCELEQLLSHDLGATFRSAIQKIVECGHTEEVAEWAVLRSGIYCGFKDAVSNIVDGALAYLEKEKEFDTQGIYAFEDLHSVASYTMLEMVCVLRELRPALSIAEAIWCLLICDSNLSHLCSVKGNPLTAKIILGESSGSKSPHSKSYDKNEKPPIPNLQFGEVTYDPNAKNPHVSEGPKESLVQLSVTRTTITGEKTGGSRRGASRRDMLRQKTLLFEKNCKGHLPKGAYKARLTTVGNMVLEKKLKNISTTSIKIGANPPLAGGSHNLSSNNPSCTTPSTLPKKDAISEEKQSQDSSSKNLDYYAQIPYDESTGKYVPQGDRDEVMLSLLNMCSDAGKDIQNWTKWANEKVMQAARRLGQDNQELKKLRAEKEEFEKFQKDKKISEENSMKRLGEMECAIVNASGQIEMANATAKRLEAENEVLKKEMDGYVLEAQRAFENMKEAELKAQEALKSMQFWERKKALLQEDVKNTKGRINGVLRGVEKDKDRLRQIKVQREQVATEMAGLNNLVDSIISKREQMIAAAQADNDLTRQKAEDKKKKLKDDIKKLETEISEMKLQAEASKIAALRKGISFSLGEPPIDVQGAPNLWGFSAAPKVSKRLPFFRDNFGEGRDRECVMCLNEDKSVVFLPCAHQVVCEKCNVLHEEEGMKDCPACRTPIKRRVNARFSGL
ncbi:hypothetical protein LguiA_020360 [Lonicera macranthoides]